MGKLLDKVKGYFDIGATVVSGLELVGDLAGGKLAQDKPAGEILHIIHALVETIRSGLSSGSMTAAEISAHIAEVRAKLKADIAQNDADIDAEVDEKFPKGEP